MGTPTPLLTAGYRGDAVDALLEARADVRLIAEAQGQTRAARRLRGEMP